MEQNNIIGYLLDISWSFCDFHIYNRHQAIYLVINGIDNMFLLAFIIDFDD